MKLAHILLALGLVLAGCSLQTTVIEPTTPFSDGDATPTPAESTEPAETEESAETTEAEEPADTVTFDGFALTYTEGDLVELSPEAIDPDGDTVTYRFGEPLNSQGRWQTAIGDEGNYLVTISASDGELTTDSNLLLIIERANRAPVIDCVDQAVLAEGERFYVGNYCEYYDEDEEDVVVFYSGWPGVSRYVTTYDDAGEHTLLITANDKTHVVKQELAILVTNTNRAPTFPEEFTDKIIGMEGDILTIDLSANDPDGDKIRYQVSKPFNNKGIWRTELGDAGTYDIDVVASDGENTLKRTVTVEVQLANTKPTLKFIPDISVQEGETIVLPISASDREGDELSVKISGWMDSDTYTTTYDDAGEYTVTVKVSDGVNVESQVVRISVENVNRAPEFVTVA